jgi:hypothetical protein
MREGEGASPQVSHRTSFRYIIRGSPLYLPQVPVLTVSSEVSPRVMVFLVVPAARSGLLGFYVSVR